jgi:hypothetical protein
VIAPQTDRERVALMAATALGWASAPFVQCVRLAGAWQKRAASKHAAWLVERAVRYEWDGPRGTFRVQLRTPYMDGREQHPVVDELLADGWTYTEAGTELFRSCSEAAKLNELDRTVGALRVCSAPVEVLSATQMPFWPAGAPALAVVCEWVGESALAELRERAPRSGVRRVENVSAHTAEQLAVAICSAESPARSAGWLLQDGGASPRRGGRHDVLRVQIEPAWSASGVFCAFPQASRVHRYFGPWLVTAWATREVAPAGAREGIGSAGLGRVTL